MKFEIGFDIILQYVVDENMENRGKLFQLMRIFQMLKRKKEYLKIRYVI